MAAYTTTGWRRRRRGAAACLYIHVFLFALIIHICSCLQTQTATSNTNLQAAYATYWENLLLEEYQDTVADLRDRRRKLSRNSLEQAGISIFGAVAEPDSDLFGEKIVRIYKDGETKFRDRFNRGDVLVMTPIVKTIKDHTPRECLIVDIGTDWITMGVGPTWPSGLWESRKLTGFYEVRLDRTAPQSPLRAQRKALDLLRNGYGGKAANLLANLFYNNNNIDKDTTTTTSTIKTTTTSSLSDDMERWSTGTQQRQDIEAALEEAKMVTKFHPNWSQEESIITALQKRVSLIRGPPGTGKTRVAALLISTAIRLQQTTTDDDDKNDDTASSSSDQTLNQRHPPRVLAVTHSNGAADVLLEALLQMGVPAIRLGRPAAVSANVQHRTAIAMSEKMPEVVRLRRKVSDPTMDSQARAAAAYELRHLMADAQGILLKSAPVVVTTCIGAHQLLDDYNRDSSDSDDSGFPLVVLDEAAQTTEPALMCALVAARAEQICLVGDTRQLPPTITSMQLRDTLGVSPMSRLEELETTKTTKTTKATTTSTSTSSLIIGKTTLRVQYRMPAALLEHPSIYFYKGLVKCSKQVVTRKIPDGFPWPSSQPLAFVQTGKGDSEIMHNQGGRSNAEEANVVVSIVMNLLEANSKKDDNDDNKRSSSRRRKERFNVAVISPYSKQVQLIRSKLADAALISGTNISSSQRMEKMVRVGTVDSFQGQETDVVVLSTVRSNPIQELGFLRDSRRLCVAITRARSGLVVVGDKATLNSCRHWSALIASMEKRGCLMSTKDYWLQSSSSSSSANDDDIHDDTDDNDQKDKREMEINQEDADLYGLFKASDDKYGLF